MRALLYDRVNDTLVALQVEEAVYDEESQMIDLYSSSGDGYEVERVIRLNADNLIRRMVDDGKADFTAFKSISFEDAESEKKKRH